MEEEYEQKLKSLKPEIKNLKDKVKYLSRVNMQVKEAQKVTEDFVNEVVTVNELLATTLKEKKREIRHLSKEKTLRRSES